MLIIRARVSQLLHGSVFIIGISIFLGHLTLISHRVIITWSHRQLRQHPHIPTIILINTYKKMHTSTFLLTLAAPVVVLAHVAVVVPRQASVPAPAVPAPTAAPEPQPAAPDHGMDHGTMDHNNPQPTTAAPTPTRPTPSAYADLAKCELAIDTLLKAFSMVPTPNAALSSFLATETASVSDPCQWASDVPDGLQGAYSTYSREYVSVLSENADLVTQLVSCVDAGGASVTRAEIVTPLFKLPQCEEVKATSTTGGNTAGGNAATTTTRGFPTGSSTSSAGAGATGVAIVGVAAAALLGVAGAL